MKQILLALLLTAAPVAAFTGFQVYMVPHAAQAADGKSLGDLSSLSAIVADVTAIAASGDLAKAKTRIKDFETAWDDAQGAMQPLNPDAWGAVDTAADHALRALRAGTPDAAQVNETLVALTAALASPAPQVGGGTIGKVAGIVVTDASGHALPCENLLKSLKAAIAAGKVVADKTTVAADFVTKGTERCNSDDDLHANEFSAQGLALITP